MEIVCLDLEGVLVPEIWIRFSEETGVSALALTTRDIPDYDELMQHRIRLLRQNGYGLRDIQEVIAGIDPLPGAARFLADLRRHTQVAILSDTFTQFAHPLMAKLEHPLLLCNELQVDENDAIVGYRMRQPEGKRRAVEGFQHMALKVTAAGDSYNDLTMLRQADRAALFRSPQRILSEVTDLPHFTDYEELRRFVLEEPVESAVTQERE